ncbi:Forkhead box protein O [Colletotrichum chlorophyti]|uniref:Forkhead box protein O n=1 Tax=Colletotrichum chlorophyti TaxID=708187 RepID=A0A1Q8RM82_9PEZI|nr:Forkhead box protein O [Colletotrichum chlorophyti]
MTTSSAQPAHATPENGDLNQQHTITTQTPTSLAVRTEMVENYNSLASGQRQFPVQDAQQPYYAHSHLSAVGHYHSPNMNQTAWSSPQSMCADEFESNYSYRGPAVSTSYNPAPLSPRSWPSSMQTPPSAGPQFELPLRSDQEHVFGVISDHHLSMSPEDLRGADLHVSLHYDNSNYSQVLDHGQFEDEGMQYGSSPMADGHTSPYAGSSVSFADGIKMEPGCITDFDAPSVPRGQTDSKSREPGEEPYAKLIHKALGAAPNHSMTLQQLYQWFKDNTDKPERTEKNGWQNSIRHNLSMNQAFMRREKEVYSQDGNSTSAKKVSEWYLNPVYIDKILPTTHFRPGPRQSRRNTTGRRNSPPRSSQITHYQNPDFPHRSMPGRAMSGRRGGRATNNLRNARRNRSTTGSLSPVANLLPHPYPPAHVIPMSAGGSSEMPMGASMRFQQHRQAKHRGREQNQAQAQAQGQIRMATPVSPGNASPVTVGPCPAPALGSNVSGTTTSGGNFVGQPYQLQQQYTVTDVAGVYDATAQDPIYGWSGPNAQM